MASEDRSGIPFQSPLETIGSWTIVRIPEEVSRNLPSRGMTLVDGTFNGTAFQAVLEPDGRGRHWFRVDDGLLETAEVSPGDSVAMAIRPSRDWPEPDVPSDLAEALTAHPPARVLWDEITPMARWDWIRWIRSTRQEATRRRRIAAACDKLSKGERRPCCFNRNLCSEPSVSRAGVLLDPS